MQNDEPNPGRRRRSRDCRADLDQPAPRRLRGQPCRRRRAGAGSGRCRCCRSSSSSTGCCPARAAMPLARQWRGSRRERATCRSSCSPRAPTKPTRCRASTPAPTTTSPSRSRRTSCWRASVPCCRRRAPDALDAIVEVGALSLNPATHRVVGSGREVKIGADRVQAAPLPDVASRARAQPHAAARPGLGRPRVHRGAHGRRSHQAAARGAAPRSTAST